MSASIVAKADKPVPYLFPSLQANQLTDHQEYLDRFLRQHSSIQFVRLQWQDYSGLLRTRIVTVAHYRNMINSHKPFHTPPIGFHCIVDNNLVPDLDPTGAHLLLPDYGSLRILPDRPRYAILMCGIVETRPVSPQPNWDLCPRRALANVLHTAAHAFGVNFLVGFEVEFEILHRPSSLPSSEGGSMPPLVPFSTGLGRFAAAGLRDPAFVLVERVVQTLLDSGVGVQAFQTEGRRGQYEISLAPQSPLDAIDELVLVHDTLKESFTRLGYIVTMAPKPIAGRRQAIGQHTHVSMHSATTATSLAEQQSFLAGILAALPMLCAVCLPYELSYERVQPYLGGSEVAWGTENREVPIRQIRPGHWELRCVDATANMYLALATVLSAGLLGLQRQEPLRWRDTAFPVEGKCHDCVDGIKKSNETNGTVKETAAHPREQLPQNLERSLHALEHGGRLEELESTMGSRVLRHYLSVKKYEASKVREMDQQAARDLLTELF